MKAILPILEVCVDTIEDAELAQAAGADRIELCAAIAIGGITPSVGFMKAAANLQIPVYAIIRPRDGDFCYNDAEIEIMKSDIEHAKQANLDGVVFGALTPDDQIDIETSKMLISLAAPLPVALHRAFDVTTDPKKALEDAIEAGFERVLTSGQAIKAVEGESILSMLRETAAERITIMAGGGVNKDNAAELMSWTKSNELHASCAEVISAHSSHSDGRKAMQNTGKKFGFEPAGGLKRLSKVKLVDLKAAMLQQYHSENSDNSNRNAET